MQCQYVKCKKDHEGTYGSGRFCSSKCAKGFSTLNKRKEINEKVSKALRGKLGGRPFKEGFDPRRKIFSQSDRLLAKEKIAKNRALLYGKLDWENLPKKEKRRRVLKEQNNICLYCGLNIWLGKKLLLEFHHKNGNKKDNSRNNLEILCPNCHSLTDTFRNSKRN